jgi:hypothetical protein
MRHVLILTAAITVGAVPARAEQGPVPAPFAQPVPVPPATSQQSATPTQAAPSQPELLPAQSGRTPREQPSPPLPTQPGQPTQPEQPQ